MPYSLAANACSETHSISNAASILPPREGATGEAVYTAPRGGAV